VDRGERGSKLHVLTDAAGLPLAVATSAANTHDSLALIPLVQAIPAIRSRARGRAGAGRHRWVVERSLAWLTGYRRLTLRYERSARLFAVFLTLAATLACYKKLAT
jgi:hypothetical protein